jgi:hypothetical protein
MGHIDDSLLLGYDHKACKNNYIVDSTKVFQQLGFVIHPEKSVLHPVQVIEFLGFVTNILSMTVRLIPMKITKVKSFCHSLLNKHKPTIIEVAQVIGLLVSSLPAVQFGPLHYRNLEGDKISNKGHFDSPMTLSTSLI